MSRADRNTDFALVALLMAVVIYGTSQPMSAAEYQSYVTRIVP